MPQLSRNDRVRGCMLGLATGDALGAPLEGLSAPQIRAHYGLVDQFVDGHRAWKKKPYRWRMPGLYTDDTQQALALAEVLLDCGKVEGERLAELYIALANPKGSYIGAHRGVGRSFRQVLNDLERGVDPIQTGQASAGIGAAMRIAPLALHFQDDRSGMFDSMMTASLMTHRDIRSLSGASAVLHTIRRIMLGEERDASLLFRIASDVAKDEDLIGSRFPEVSSVDAHGHAMSRAVAHVESVLELPRERALAMLVEEANRHGAEPVCKRPTMGFPPACIPTCLYLWMTTDSFEDALIEVVNMGGDADSAGAILGAFAGAFFGVNEIPDRWLAQLQNRQGIDVRARALARQSKAGLVIPDFIRTEQWLSELEANCREALLATSGNGGDLGANRLI